jgi:hypothetical protein
MNSLTKSQLIRSDTPPIEVGDNLFIRVTVERDDCMGPPWKEADSHGPVTGWERRDKRPGERILSSDHGANRFYDYAAAMELARKDGWGLGPNKLAALERGLGRKATAGEIRAAAVDSDFEFLRGWCNDDWEYVFVSVKLEDEDGREIASDCIGGVESCGDYWVELANGMASELVESHGKEQAESNYWACRDSVTVGA